MKILAKMHESVLDRFYKCILMFGAITAGSWGPRGEKDMLDLIEERIRGRSGGLASEELRAVLFHDRDHDMTAWYWQVGLDRDIPFEWSGFGSSN